MALTAGCAAREAAKAPEAASVEARGPRAAPVEPAPQAVMPERRPGATDPARIREGLAEAELMTPVEADRRMAARREAERRAYRQKEMAVDRSEAESAPVTESLNEAAAPPAEAPARSLDLIDKEQARADAPRKQPAPTTRSATTRAPRKTSDGSTAGGAGAPAVGATDDFAFQSPIEDTKAKAGKKKAEEKKRTKHDAPISGFARPTVVAARDASPGRLWIEDARGGRTALTPRALRVVAHVQGVRARTVLDFVFENPTDARREGTFHVELPPDATVAGFSVFDGAVPRDAVKAAQSLEVLLPPLAGGFLPPEAQASLTPSGSRQVDWRARADAAVVEDTDARQAQAAAVEAGADGSLVQWGGGQTFTARVFPIEGSSLKRVVVVYEAPLARDGAQASYALPAAPGAPAQATVFVDPRHGQLSTRWPDARIVSTPSGWLRVDAPAARFGQRLDLSVGSKQAVLRSKAGAGLEGDAFFAQVVPPVSAGAPATTGRALFLVDTSASQTPEIAARQAALLEALLTEDESIEQFAVLLFDVRARWLGRLGYQANTAAARRRTLAELRKVYFEGATSLEAAAEAVQAQRSWAVAGAPTTAFLLSDGHVTWGEADPRRLFARYPALREVRLVAYRFDGRPSHGARLAELARGSAGGRIVSVSHGGGVSAAARAHRAPGADLLSVEVEGAPSADLVVDGDPTTLFPGQALSVAGRLPQGGAARLVVRYRGAQGESRVAVSLGAPRDADKLAVTAWADLYARHLDAKNDPRLDRVLVAMGRRFSLSNRKASFVLLEPGRRAQNDAQASAVDVADLLSEVRRAEARSRRDAEGLSSADLAPEVQALLTELRRRSDGPPKGAPLVHAPEAGGPERFAAEAAYRAQAPLSPGDLRVYERIARARALAGDTAGAVRALSTPVERAPRDASAMRTVGYALLALEQFPAAVELFARVRRLFPFEVQSYLEEALALEGVGRSGEAALRYERALAQDLGEQPELAKRAAAAAYAQMLARLDGEGPRARRAALTARFGEVAGAAEAELAVRALWSEGAGDVDLIVYEPDGARCSSARPGLPSGSRLVLSSRTGRQGYELYAAPRARPGAYDLMVHYRRGPRYVPNTPAGVLVVVDRPDAPRRFLTRLLDLPTAVLLVRTERF